MPDDLTGRKPGYLASIDNVPPLIFRFQINPEISTEKRSFKWDEVNDFGSWKIDSAKSAAAAAGAGLVSAVLPASGLFDAQDTIKKFSASLVMTRPLKANVGEPRTFALDFALDATLASVLDEGDHYGGSIEPDLFILRSFVNPSMDLISFGKWVFSGFESKNAPTGVPPLCSLYYAGLSVTCVMTDLNIKVTAYKADGKPQRAEVSVTLKEQTLSVGPIIDFIERNIQVARSLGRKNIGEDFKNVTPILNLFT
ncbi:MAG TPA: hypothetical protein VF591_25910 [Pyrinomonadaceae bacterium]|jgi:hypothetical protein